MSPAVHCCAICGCIIDGCIIDEQAEIVSWMNQFRGLYSGPDGIVLTGVGLYTGLGRDSFIAPPDPSARWDDPGYNHPDEDNFAVMARYEINDRRGFVFHDACWSLLEQAFRPAPVPCVRLFEVCDSLPLVKTEDSINWGHDYGGLDIIRDQHLFSWEKPFADREFPDGLFDTLYAADPLAVSEVDRILAETPQPPPVGLYPGILTDSGASSGNDPFSALPMELCSAIAEYLPTPDVRLDPFFAYHPCTPGEAWRGP